MPHIVAPWTWRRALRDDGPDDPGFLLAMMILATYMDESGFAYPGQPLWAKGARKSVRMIQRYIARARQEGWLVVVNAGRGGKGWAFNAYRCCVPSHVVLREKDEQIADGIISTYGDIDDGDTAMSSPTSNGHDTRVSAREERRSFGADTGDSKVTTPQAHGDDTTRTKVPTQLWRTKFSSESSPLKLAQEEGALSRTAVGRDACRDKESEGERLRRVISLLDRGLPYDAIVDVLGASGVTISEVVQVAQADCWDPEPLMTTT